MKGADAVIIVMQHADALRFPSRSEGHPLVVIEAMACGLPDIATQGSSLIEVVVDDNTVILCTSGDAQSFAVAVKRLATDCKLGADIKAATRQRAVECFSIDKMIDAYLGTYSKPT